MTRPTTLGARKPGATDGLFLDTFFERAFLPIKLRGARDDYAASFIAAIAWLARALGRRPTLVDLTGDFEPPLAACLQLADTSAATAVTVRKRLRALWRYGHALGMIDEQPAAKPRGLSLAAAEVEAERGTVLHYFETVYRPQRLLGAAGKTVVETRRALLALRVHCGRDILLPEQTDALAADHFTRLLASGRQAVTVNTKYRAPWFAVWRLAHERGLVDREPKVKKLREQLDSPDAWTEAEAARLIAASRQLQPRLLAGVPANTFWPALLLVGYWTGLRRGSLFSLLWQDVDLHSGWLYVRPAGVKTRRGKRCRIGADAIEALNAIRAPERELVFPYPPGVENTSREFSRILAIAQLAPSARRAMTQFHKLRRTTATHAAKRGGLAAAISLLDHSGPEVTKRYIDPSHLTGMDATQVLEPLPLVL